MYDYNQTLPEATLESINYVWTNMALYIPRIALAIVLFAVFLVIASAFEKVVSRIVSMLKVDDLLSKIGVGAWVGLMNMRLNSGAFVGAIVKWFFVIAGLLVAANILGLSEVSSFLTQVLYYVPSVLVAAVILIVGAIVADALSHAAGSSITASGLKSGPFIQKVVRWAVFIFALMWALDQLGVASTFLNTLYIGIVAMIALAGGLAFGLGGKEHAAELIAKIKRDISH